VAGGGEERILVVPFADGIGDFVMMLPLLAAVRRRFPAAAVTVAASQRSALLLDEAQAAGFDVRTPSWLREGPRPRGGPLRRLVPQGVLAALAGVALQCEFGHFDRTLNLFRWWERGIDFRRHWTPQVPPREGAVHTLDYLADRLASELGQALPAAARRPRVALRAAAVELADAWWQAAGLALQSVVALAPASNMQIKRWPLGQWARLCDGLAAAGCRPLLVLPPGQDVAERILHLARRPPLAVTGPLDRVAALLARCRVVVGVDTGLLHVAAAVGTRYVGLFGPTNPLVTGPYDRTLGTALVAPFAKTGACRGCWRQFKYIDDRCRTLPAGSCMGALRAETVLDACLAELARSA
jgi:ADP-heptose:LPS heptosyltransferase